MTGSTICIQRPGLKIQQVDDEMVLLDEENGYIHQLNHTASFVWNQCDGKSSVTQITRRFADEFEVDVSIATSDVGRVIEQLLELKLLQK